MAPTAISTYQDSKIGGVASKSKVKDEVITSGQHPPIYEALKPYEYFPKYVDGRTFWRREDYNYDPERWTHRFTADEIGELSDAADNFSESGIALTTISKVLRHHETHLIVSSVAGLIRINTRNHFPCPHSQRT